ncbi:hypothetical protein EH223_16465, partial [candidate division KSB1 bacterium]
MKHVQLLLLFTFFFAISSPSDAQKKLYEGPVDGAGDVAAEKIGWMEGNAVRCQFRNTTELSDWGTGTDPYATRWPNDFRGSKMNDGIGLLIGCRVYIHNDGDSLTVDSRPFDEVYLSEFRKQYDQMVASGQLHRLHYLETSYRERQDTDPTGQVEWNLYPSRGNIAGEYANWGLPDTPPAQASKPDSWPTSAWPADGYNAKWSGQWNGRFGADAFKSDEECFFVANDAQDQENLVEAAKIRYYPLPERYIGDIDPKMSVQVGLPWGGVGLRVEQRGFQWNNAQARDAIFWEYVIYNMTHYNLPEVAFGYWVDNAIGGEDGNDELAAFDTFLDLSYSWDVNGIGTYGLAVGTMGFAYLESPGNSTDGFDNDEDGLIDEKRDNIATQIVGPYDGIDNLANFLKFYQLEEADLREHWKEDEDQDWEAFDDANGNGRWDEGEDINDDVGTDGKGPGEIDYREPDANGTEANGQPDLQIGLGCEPDFGLLDVTETDMLGLTSFRLFPVPSGEPPYTWWFRNDASMWDLVGQDSLVPYIGQVSNLIEVFATGIFPLYGGNIERISMSELHSWDDGRNIKAGDPVENPPIALFELKKIVQIIYETDYRFAIPPVMPTLTATPGDGRILLTWNNDSEIKTRDPFLGNENDFEGYKLFKATDRNITDAVKISDGYGNERERRWVFQCDLVNSKKGFANYGLVDGAAYYLGNDTGISHSYVDENVQNGRTYYYALVAYDYGMPDIGVRPSENNFEIKVDEAENVIFTSKNVAIVTPRPYPAGYHLETSSEIIPTVTLGAGSIATEMVAKNATFDGATYKVKFDIERIREIRNMNWGIRWVANGLRIYRHVDSSDLLVYQESPENPGTMLVDSTETLGYWYIHPDSAKTDIFDGITMTLNTPVIEAEYDYLGSGWQTGSGPISVTPANNASTGIVYYLPWDYDIIWAESYTSEMAITTSTRIYDENYVRVRDGLLEKQTFPFTIQTSSVLDTTGAPRMMEMVVQDMDLDGLFDITKDRIFVGALDDRDSWAATAFVLDFTEAESESDLPAAGSDAVYKANFLRPFFETDSIMFKININETTVAAEIGQSLENIKVVPNPYVSTNALEPSLANKDFNQRRRIMWTHVPARCTIKIFTPSGVFVDEIVVENSNDDGIAYWDLLTKDRLEAAAGMYIYHLEAETGDTIMGKFAI